MRVLLTGGTGFLGKRLLQRLLADPRIEKVHVLTRSKRSHPDPKVRIHKIDLSITQDLYKMPTDVDAIIHLAGLYDFGRGQAENYANNVLVASNLVETIRTSERAASVPILFASSYVVGVGGTPAEGYNEARSLPPEDYSYAYTKALSERLIVGSGSPCSIFRVGVLVGDTETGSIEKLDGPYFFVETLCRIAALSLSQKLRRFIPALPLPLPADPDKVLPFVPVDVAARVFHEALFKSVTFQPGSKIYGVYDPQSVKVRDLCDELIRRIAPQVKPLFLGQVSGAVMAKQSIVTGVPEEAMRMSYEPIHLDSSRFKLDFPEIEMPRFETYSEKFVSGYRIFRENRSS